MPDKRRFPRVKALAGAVLCGCVFSPAILAQNAGTPTNALSNNHEALVQTLITNTVCSQVSRRACGSASVLLARMMKDIQLDILKRLAGSRLKIVIIPESKKLDAMPQAASLLEDRKEIEKILGPLSKVRGIACIKQSDGSYATLVNEENLIHGQGLYTRWFNFVHELGHTVYKLGLSDAQRKEIDDIFKDAKRKELLFPDKQSSSHPTEFFAQGTAIWFGVHGSARVTTPLRNAKWLLNFQPEFYSALKRIYAPVTATASSQTHLDVSPAGNRVITVHGDGPGTGTAHSQTASHVSSAGNSPNISLGECSDAASCYARADSRAKKGDCVGGIEDYTKAIGFAPDFQWAWYHRGLIRKLLKDENGSFSDLQHAATLDPSFVSRTQNPYEIYGPDFECH